MTTQAAKTATVAIVALGIVAAMLAYSAFVTPASAQTATTNATSSSTATSTTNSASSTSTGAPPPGQGPWGGFGGPGQGAGGRGGAFQGQFQGGPARGGYGQQAVANLTVGQTITVTSTQGMYYVVGSSGTNGTASGTLTFTVTGKLTGGYTLSISSGSLTIDGKTYTVSSGSAQMGPGAQSLAGQGSTTPSGEFLINASARGSFAGTSANVSLDLSSGSTEYLVSLAGTISG